MPPARRFVLRKDARIGSRRHPLVADTLRGAYDEALATLGWRMHEQPNHPYGKLYSCRPCERKVPGTARPADIRIDGESYVSACEKALGQIGWRVEDLGVEIAMSGDVVREMGQRTGP